MVDTSIFDSLNISDRIQIAQIRRLRVNKDPSTVLFRGFLGGEGGRQLEEFTRAMTKAQDLYRKQGITVISEMYDQDTIKNVLKLGPREFTTYVLEGDAHLYITHFHEGNIAKTASWNIPNILANVDRLSHHLGNLMGAKNKCPIYRQGKKEVYEMLPDHCLPTLIINLPLENWIEDAFYDENVERVRR
jgi:hypothetical protein